MSTIVAPEPITIDVPEPIVEVPTMPDQVIKNRRIFLRTLRLAPEECREQRYYFWPSRWTGEPVQKFCVNGLALLCTGQTRETYPRMQRTLADIVGDSLGLAYEGVQDIDLINEDDAQTFAKTADWLEEKWESGVPYFNQIPEEYDVVPFIEDVILPVLITE